MKPSVDSLWWQGRQTRNLKPEIEASGFRVHNWMQGSSVTFKSSLPPSWFLFVAFSPPYHNHLFVSVAISGCELRVIVYPQEMRSRIEWNGNWKQENTHFKAHLWSTLRAQTSISPFPTIVKMYHIKATLTMDGWMEPSAALTFYTLDYWPVAGRLVCCCLPFSFMLYNAICMWITQHASQLFKNQLHYLVYFQGQFYVWLLHGSVQTASLCCIF